MARGRRSWVQWLLITASVALVVGSVLGVSTVVYGVYRVERVPQIQVRQVLQPPAPPGDPFNVLLVGDSTRDFVETEEDRASFGADEGRGADSILLVRIDPRAGTAATLPFPRDLWVELADGSGPQRINRAYERGGASLLIETVRNNFFMPINHYVQLDFRGFRGLVDAVGGIELHLDAPVRDFDRRRRSFGVNQSGLDIREVGCVEMDGATALAYVRSRHFERLIDGEWVPDGRSDFGRSERQQQFLRQVLAKGLAEDLLTPGRVLRLLEVADESLKVSDDLDAERITELVRDVRRLSPESVTDYALPVTDLVTPAGAQVLQVDMALAEPVLDVFRGITPTLDTPNTLPPVPPGDGPAPPVAPTTPTTVAPADVC